MENTFYKHWIEILRSKEKQKSNLLNESLQMRENTTTLLIKLQDLAHPQKWVTLEEAKKRLEIEETNLKDINCQMNYNESSEFRVILDLDLNAIKNAVEKADICLKQNKINKEETLI